MTRSGLIAGTAAAALTLGALFVHPAGAQEVPQKKLYPMQAARVVPTVTVDTSDAPDARAWGDAAKALVQQWYPYVVSMLATEKWESPKSIRIVIKKDLNVPAYTSGPEITINGAWIKAHPDDFGMVIHEMTHIVQSYPGYRGKPGWLVEGIADYIRWWRYEPEAPRTRIDKEKAKYSDSYRTTAAFLAFVAGRYDRGIVYKLDKAMRERQDPMPLFAESTGKSPDDLWTEFLATLR